MPSRFNEAAAIQLRMLIGDIKRIYEGYRFNEAAAIQLRMLILTRRNGSSIGHCFNEAAAIQLRMPQDESRAVLRWMGFNEAAAIQLRMRAGRASFYSAMVKLQ